MVLKLTIFINKNDDISFEEFSNYWKNNHGDLFVSCGLAAKYVLKYSQYHVVNTPEIKQLTEEAKLPMLEYDGYGEFWFEGIEQVAAMAADETYQKVVVPDEVKFTKRNEWKIMVGEVTEKFCSGERPA